MSTVRRSKRGHSPRGQNFRPDNEPESPGSGNPDTIREERIQVLMKRSFKRQYKELRKIVIRATQAAHVILVILFQEEGLANVQAEHLCILKNLGKYTFDTLQKVADAGLSMSTIMGFRTFQDGANWLTTM